MFDSNIYDKVIANEALFVQLRSLIDSNQLEIVSTHIQLDELGRIENNAKRESALAVPSTIVPTMGFVLDVSRLDMACLDGGNPEIIEYEQIQKGNLKHVEDALIALTAHHEADVLVTEDNKLINKIKATKTKLTLWKFEEFKSFLDSVKNNGSR